MSLTEEILLSLQHARTSQIQMEGLGTDVL